MDAPFSLDALPSITEAEVRVRARLAGSSLLASAIALLDGARSRGAVVSIGRLDVLHGAIVERLSRGAGGWHLVEATDVGACALLHASEAATHAVMSAIATAAHVHVTPLDGALARERLRASGHVALLPVDVSHDGARDQLRIFLFPDGARGRRLVVSRSLAVQVDVDVALVTAITWLRAGALRALSPGDAITLDFVAETGTLLGRLAGDTADLALRADGLNITYDGRASRPRAASIGLEASMCSEDVPLAGWEDVEVELTLDVGSVRIPLAELATLAVGAVLVPDRGHGDRATIRVNGRAIGRGTLVRVDGALAVRIDALADAARDDAQ